MKKYVLDTSAIISFVTDRNPSQQEKMAGIFEAATLQKYTLICPQHVLTEFVFVMDRVYKVEETEINVMIRDFITMPGIEICHEIDFSTLLAVWPNVIPDFGDAIVGTVCKTIKSSAVITFDAKFTAALKKAGINVSDL